MRHPYVALFALPFVTIAACSDSPVTTDAGPDASDSDADAATAVPAGFDRFCAGKDFASSLADATVSTLSGTYKGYYPSQVVKPGSLETMKVIPTEPFMVDKIRVAFASGSGTARLHLEGTFGRSYPMSFPQHVPGYKPTDFPDYDPNAVDLVTPMELDVQDATPDQWLEVDVSDQHVALLPTQHYMIVYEHETTAPFLAIEDVPPTEYSRALLFQPNDVNAYGVEIDQAGTQGNYRLELVGHTFCAWSPQDRFFTDGTPSQFTQTAFGAVEIADIDGDGHDDLMVSDVRTGDGPRPRAYFGDGAGNFTAASFDALALANEASMLVFGDFDNDGDQDVMGMVYIQPDADGDGVTIENGDCNDTDPSIHPGATEVANGKDDDCNGIADDGTSGAASTADADKDGYTIAAGDCDDTNAAVHPGATELLDAVDNDCNGKADETFHHMMLLNQGGGHFVQKPSPAIEFSEPASEIAIGDANGDGKLDAYWGDWLIHYPDAPAGPSHFVTGNGDGTFTDAMTSSGMIIADNKPVYGVTFNDFNGDGLQDIYVGNYQLNDNLLWQNMGSGTFSNVAAALHVDHDSIATTMAEYPGGHSYGSDFGDIDNDGKMDFWQSNLSHPRTQPWADPSQLYFNQGNGNPFVDKRHAYGIVYDEGDINGFFGDFDNDGDLDLVVGSLYTGHYDKLYRNDGDHFTDVSFEAGVAEHQGQNVAWADVDEDGALDLIVRGSDFPQFHIFRNQIGKQNNWIELRLEGTKTNRDAIGARVTLKAGGTTQIRDVKGTCGGGISAGLCSRVVHFGLAKNTQIDSLEVRWVEGQTANAAPVEAITGAAPNGIYKIVEGSGAATKIK
jgi:hypothetical protein